MKYQMPNQADEYTQARRKRRNWQKVVAVLAALVVFCTTYALILPAITLEKPERVLDCPVSVHQHTVDCYDEVGKLICGQADYIVHVHNEDCVDKDGKLVCPLTEIEAHEHTDACYEEQKELVCGIEENSGHVHGAECYTREQGALICLDESEEHVHTEACYEWNDVLICGIAEGNSAHSHTDECYSNKRVLVCDNSAVLHKHTESCYDANSNLICGQLEVLEHKHESGCFVQVENNETETVPEETEGTEELIVAPYGAVLAAWAEVEWKEAAMPAKAPLKAAANEGPENLTSHLVSAKIQVDGKDYTGGPLDQDKSFTVVLSSEIPNNGLSYQYKLPDQIVIKDTGSAEQPIALMAGDIKVGNYYIKDNTIYLNYEQSYNEVTTTLKLSANWAEDLEDKETIEWGNGQHTDVEFTNKDIVIEKTDNNKGVMKVDENGDLFIEYTIQAMLDQGGTLKISDTMVSNISPEIVKLWTNAYNDGKADYEITIHNYSDGVQVGAASYGKFPAGSTSSFSIEGIELEKDQYAEVKYKVKVTDADRAALDFQQKKLEVKNTARAESEVNDKPISADVTHNVTYQAPNSWIQKTVNNTGENSNADDKWMITVNGLNRYNVEGAVVMDYISGNGADDNVTTYNIENGDFTVTIAGKDGASETKTLQIIDISTWAGYGGYTVDDFETYIASLSELKSIEAMNASIDSFQDALQDMLNTTEKVDVALLSQYVFVDNSSRKKSITGDTGPLFLWIAPPNAAVTGAGEAPYSYTLNYSAHSEEGTTAVVNQAISRWQGYLVGTGPITVTKQQIAIDKSNSGVYTGSDGNLYVDWTINLTVPENSAELKDIWLVDRLPEADVRVSDAFYKTYPSLVGLSSETLDGAFLKAHENDFHSNKPFSKEDPLVQYLHELAENVFTITVEGDEKATDVAENAYPILGATGHSLTNNFQTYSGLAERLGTMNLIGFDGAGKASPKMFSIYLGDLPATQEGYTITTNYTTKVNPYTMPLTIQDDVEATNNVDLYADLGNGRYTKLGDAHSSYWLAKQSSEDSVIKNIVDFDQEERILTYRVELDPLNNLGVQYLAYQIHDSLDKCPGATYIEDSFKLYIHGEPVGEMTSNKAWEYAPEIEQLVWASHSKYFEEYTPGSFERSAYDYLNAEVHLEKENITFTRVDQQVSNDKSGKGSSNFYMTLNNDGWLGTKDGYFVPMTLEYQVQLPKEATQDNRYIENEVLFSAYAVTNPSSIYLIGASRTSFDTQNIMHKTLYDTPTLQNNYRAGFQIVINRYESKDLMEAKEINVEDELSDTLELVVSSVKLEGKDKDDKAWNEISSNGWKLEDGGNGFNVKIFTDTAPVYDQYRLTYQAKVLGDSGTTVHYSNKASIKSLGITSETVEKNVYIQEVDGSSSVKNLEITLLKVDGNDMTVRLDGVTFELWTYSKEEGWRKQDKDPLTTKEGGKIQLINGQNVSVDYNIWYALKETEAKEGYLPTEPVYFYIPKTGTASPEKPQTGLDSKPFTEGQCISAEGELRINNVTPGFTLEKRDADTDQAIYDAGFTLYSDAQCTQVVKASESTSGHFTFDQLEVNKAYYLKETKIPKGYLDPEALYKVVIDSDGNVTIDKLGSDGKPVTDGSCEIQRKDGSTVEFIAKNTPTPSYELPESGGIGTTPFAMAGTLLIITAGIFLFYTNRRRNKNTASH